MSIYVTELLVGRARQLGVEGAALAMDGVWTTGIFKVPVVGEIWLGASGLAGDEVGDTKNHGGPEKALFAYSNAHYDYWRAVAGLGDIAAGGMGENLSVAGVDEGSVCGGDVYRFCDAVVQVSQPRQPCWRPARRYRVKDLALQIQLTGKTGWYFRVLQEGMVWGGAEMVLVERPSPEWTVARCNDVMHNRKDDLELAAALAAEAWLAPNWKRTLEGRLAGKVSSVEKRVFGPNVAE